MKTTRELTCIVCPRGCSLHVEMEDGAVVLVSGHTCPRGKKYAEAECTAPMRTVTTTVRRSDGGVVAVKTESPIPKDKVFACMEALSAVTVPLPIHIGDTVLDNLYGTRAVATQNIPKNG